MAKIYADSKKLLSEARGSQNGPPVLWKGFRILSSVDVPIDMRIMLSLVLR